MMTIRMVLVDDHKVVLEGLAKYLAHETDMEIVGMARDGREAVEMVRVHRPDVVVMDITMPGLNGAEATRQIRRRCGEARVLALSMHTSPHTAAQMLQAGAVGYVTKSAPISELVHAIREVHAGRTYLSKDVADGLDPSMPETIASEAEGAGVLSPREREVLQLVVEGKSSKEIARLLHVTAKTIEHHRHNIMRKLRLDSIPDLTKFAIREGLTSLES